MTKPIRIVIPGDPKPASRPRFTRSGHVYNDPDYMVLKRSIALIAQNTMTRKGRSVLSKGRLGIELRFRRATKVRADWDNLGKTISDALEGGVYGNDSQFDEAHVYVERGVGYAEADTVVKVYLLEDKDERPAGWLRNVALAGL